MKFLVLMNDSGARGCCSPSAHGRRAPAAARGAVSLKFNGCSYVSMARSTLGAIGVDRLDTPTEVDTNSASNEARFFCKARSPHVGAREQDRQGRSEGPAAVGRSAGRSARKNGLMGEWPRDSRSRASRHGHAVAGEKGERPSCRQQLDERVNKAKAKGSELLREEPRRRAARRSWSRSGPLVRAQRTGR